MGVGEWVRDLAMTLRVLETKMEYNIFPVAKVVGQARALNLEIKRGKHVLLAIRNNKSLFTARRVGRYVFYGLSRYGRKYADELLSTIMIPTSMVVINALPYRVRLSVAYMFETLGLRNNRVHNVLVDVHFTNGYKIVEPMKATDVIGHIRVLDKGFDYENLDLGAARKEKTVLGEFPIIYSLFRYILDKPEEAYKANYEFSRRLLHTLALRPQLLNIKTYREYDTRIIEWCGRKICCECVSRETCIHNIS